MQCAAGAVELNPGWAIPFGREFWQREKVHPAEAAPAKKPSAAGRIGAGSVAPNAVLSSVCLANAMERISHAFIRENHSARWGAQSPSYIASLELDGVTFKPAPASGRAISGVSKSATST